MRIAICDDDPQAIGQLSRGIKKTSHYNRSWTIDTYEDGVKLLFACSERPYQYDVLFLDIDMPHVDGIAVGQKIRLLNEVAFIVYITNYSEFAIPAYQARPFDYLLKPPPQERIESVLADIVKRRGAIARQYLLVRDVNQQAAIALHEIYYIRCADHLTTVYAKQGAISYFKPLKAIAGEIASPYFCRVNRSTLINIGEVARYDNKKKLVLMKNGESLPVTQRNLQAFSRQYLMVLQDEHLADL